MEIFSNVGLCLVGALVLIAFVVIANAIRIVPEYQRLIVFRLGRCIGAKGPGLILLFPVVDRAVKVDLARAGARNPAPDRHYQRQCQHFGGLHLVL
jgi:regulator of protease activity HflC (stomatin/prohibitin superfamily)